MRRSARRRRTVSAYREGDRTIVLIPARMSAAEERRWVTKMLDRLAAQESRRRPGDTELTERAAHLSRQYLDGRARPDTVRWVTNQNTRWGSCTPAEGSIRLS
ncbi:M48 family metallopeptidase, partial [Streptomyces sp. SID11233]|nr:M48 family metallopeptidase [Streptomyces sp. SID11233]